MSFRELPFHRLRALPSMLESRAVANEAKLQAWTNLVLGPASSPESSLTRGNPTTNKVSND